MRGSRFGVVLCSRWTSGTSCCRAKEEIGPFVCCGVHQVEWRESPRLTRILKRVPSRQGQIYTEVPFSAGSRVTTPFSVSFVEFFARDFAYFDIVTLTSHRAHHFAKMVSYICQWRPSLGQTFENYKYFQNSKAFLMFTNIHCEITADYRLGVWLNSGVRNRKKVVKIKSGGLARNTICRG